MATVAVFGLGSMGFGIAQSVLAAGHTVYGVDISDTQMQAFADIGGHKGSVSQQAETLDCVVVVVLNAEQMEAVLFGTDGIAPRMRQGSCIVACPTVSPDAARDFADRASTFGVHYLDAPISGGAAKAREGALSIMASGSQDAFETAAPVLEATAETVFRLGDAVGAGSAMKAVNQLLAGVHIAAMSEALTFGMTQGIAPEQFLDVISKCAGTSWMLENRAPHIVSGDYRPNSQINIWPKDLGIVLDIAKSASFSAPITATALQQYMVAVGMGLGAEDDAALAKVYARNVGLKLPGDAP